VARLVCAGKSFRRFFSLSFTSLQRSAGGEGSVGRRIGGPLRFSARGSIRTISGMGPRQSDRSWYHTAGGSSAAVRWLADSKMIEGPATIYAPNGDSGGLW